MPNRFENRKIWFSRLGMASTFTPIAGTVQEWITSFEVTIPRIMFIVGISRSSLVFINRSSFEFSMNASVSVSVSKEYSYDQYHWCPIIFTEILGSLESSIR